MVIVWCFYGDCSVILGDLFDYRQHRQQMHQKEKNQYSIYKSKSYLFQKKIILQHHLSVYLNLHMLVDEKSNLYF